MKNIILIILAFSLSACVPDIEGDTYIKEIQVYGNYVADGAYYIEQNGDGDILSCIVNDSNRTCSVEEFAEVEELVE